MSEPSLETAVPSQAISDVVILVHGIRTRAAWQDVLRAKLEAHGIQVELTNFGYFDLLRFLLPFKGSEKSP